jgi:hypothetical protein
MSETKKPKRGADYERSVREDSGKIPACATNAGGRIFDHYFVPVSFVAKDWKVTARRIRFLLSEKRLEGRQTVNGYWEVAYPYRFIIGTRGPVLKRQQTPKLGRPKTELRAV